jgi:hypothetical protein
MGIHPEESITQAYAKPVEPFGGKTALAAIADVFYPARQCLSPESIEIYRFGTLRFKDF